MALAVILMSNGVKWILILLLILLLCGAVSYLLVKEKHRKDRAAQRAAERKAIRDKVLEEARSGNAQAFENLSVHKRAADQPVLSSEDSMRLAKLEKMENDLNALQSMVSSDSRRFSTTELNIAEASGEVVAKEGADDMSLGIAALANGESPVDFRHLASQLQEVETKEAEVEVTYEKEALDQEAPQEAQSQDENEMAKLEEEFKEKAPQEVKAQPAVNAPLAAVLTEEAAPLDPDEEAARKVKPFTDTEDDFEELVFSPITELPEEEESDYKPYRDEDEALADEVEKQAVLTGSTIGVPMPPVTEPPVEEVKPAAPSYDELFGEETVKEEATSDTIEAAAEVEEAPAEPEAAPAVEEIPEKEEPVEEPFEEAPVEETPVVEAPIYDKIDAPAEETTVAFKPQTSLGDTEPVKMYDTMGFTMSLEMQKLSDEERRAAREARMAEKAKYAAALAGEGDYMPEDEADDEDIDEDLDLEDEEKVSVFRVILWIFAAILSLVCVGAILYLMFGSFLKPGASLSMVKLPMVIRVWTYLLR